MGHSSMDPAFTNFGLGTRAACSVQSEPSNHSKYGRSSFGSISTADHATGRCSIWLSTANCAAVTSSKFVGDIRRRGLIRDRAVVVQQKTKRPVQFELVEPARKTLLAWLERRGGTPNNYVFPSPNDYMGHMSTRQYARLVREWVTGIGLQSEEYGTHSLRRTKASIIYKATGNLRAIQTLRSHAKIESTVR